LGVKHLRNAKNIREAANKGTTHCLNQTSEFGALCDNPMSSLILLALDGNNIFPVAGLMGKYGNGQFK
jgi:hypothetical protein